MSKKTPPDDTKVKYFCSDQTIPSAPPMDLDQQPPIYDQQPPTYDQACAAPIEIVPTPHYVPLPTGKGCVLLLQFPCHDVAAVGDFFKQNATNMLLHEGIVIAFIPEIQLFPSNKTSAVFVHFGTERTALSWLQNMKSFNPELTSRWWGMIVVNTVAIKKRDYKQFKVISIVLMKVKPDFTDSKARSDEFIKLLNEGLQPAKKRHEVWNIGSGSTIFACGDWSSFPAKASELTLSLSLYPSFEHRKAYTEEFRTDPKLKRLNELSAQKSTFIFVSGFPIGDISKFQDL